MIINPINSGVPLFSAERPRSDLEADREPADKPVEAAEEKNAASDSTRKSREGDEKQPQQLTEKEQRQLEQLKQRDREVRAHEAAHKAAGGSLIRGGASFSYATGPDGKRYATGGEVSIDTSKVPNDPAATAAKAERIRHAALAPAQPSGQDLQVAASATQMAQEARLEQRIASREETQQQQTEVRENREQRQEEIESAFNSTRPDEPEPGNRLDISI